MRGRANDLHPCRKEGERRESPKDVIEVLS